MSDQPQHPQRPTIHAGGPGGPGDATGPPPPPPGPPPARSQAGSVTGDLTDQLISTSTWSDELVAGAGIPIVDVPLVSIGAGIGSFVLADFLRVAGLPQSHLRALGQGQTPWENYEYLATVSQIPRGERLRSDAGSTPDNIWGFPSYAVREAFGAKSLTGFIAPLFQVLTEPYLTDYYTPRAGQVYETIEKEATRIGWWNMVDRGQVRMSRKRIGGGYFTIFTPPEGTAATKRIAYRSRFVHSAVGYPGVKFLPDLQAYRQKHNDYSRVVNAYEPHEHVYQELRKRPGTVVVRGSGIVGSRILQRLIDDRDNHGAQTTIIHLFRTFVDEPQGESIFMRRPAADGFAYQGFNFPKSAWGGQLKYRLEKADADGRKQLIRVMGGTNTPERKLWQRQLDRGRREGFYKAYIGTVEDVYPGDDNTIVTRIDSEHGVLELPANFIVDATGLEADIGEHRYLNDLLEHGGAGRNAVGRLDVEPTFEIRGTRNGDGRIYASGSSTLGGYYAGVDSFLGLQYAALQIHDDLASQRFVKKLGPLRSTRGWWKWAFNGEVKA